MQDSFPFGNVFSRDVGGNSCWDLTRILGLEKEKLPIIQFAICLPFYLLIIFCMQATVSSIHIIPSMNIFALVHTS